MNTTKTVVPLAAPAAAIETARERREWRHDDGQRKPEDEVIPREDARAIVYGLDPSRLVRLAYRAASRSSGLASPGTEEEVAGAPEVSPFRVSAVVLNLEDGTLRVRCWHETDPVEMPPNLVALAWADTALVEEIGRRYGEGCLLPPSEEVLEESVARAAADGIGVSWEMFEAQLRLAYDFDPDDFDAGFDASDRSSWGER